LSASHVSIRRSPALVRADLAKSAEVDDLVQEVACAMASAVRRGKLVAARPAIYRWVERTVYWLVPERSRQTVIAALTGAPLAIEPANDNARAGSELERIVFSSGETPEDTYARREDLRERMSVLTRGQRDVFERAAEGMDHAEIAIDLGISPGAVRLRLMQARRRLRRNG
jgi:RNA polymerase sigma factor (sigma-70 family)